MTQGTGRAARTADGYGAIDGGTAGTPGRVAVGVGDATESGFDVGERGAATAEYAIATMAAVAFAGLLVVILQSDEVRQILTDLVRQALTYNG